MSENGKPLIRKRLSSLARSMELVCRFALLFFLLSLVIIPLFFPAEDEAHAVVGFVLQIQGAIISFLATLGFRGLGQLAAEVRTAQGIFRAFFLFFFFAFLSEVALTFAFQVIAGAHITSVSPVGLFKAFPSYAQWYECLDISGTPKLLEFRLDVASLTIAAILGGISIYLRRQNA